VENAQTATGATKVVLTGHSLGAAIALLDAVYLPLHLPPNTTFATSVFALPRVGNRAFARYGDVPPHCLIRFPDACLPLLHS
jgi:predicted lipase